MAQGNRMYECIVFGATGYTGKYTAQHITSHLPTDFKWAVAGRSESKLKHLVDELKPLNADRLQPGVEVAQLEKDDLVNLAKKTKVLITTVGPYHKYGSVVVEACAQTSTHYLDATGETPWVRDIVQKYHDTAKKNGAIMIPQNGIESAPPDLICWLLASHVRETLDVGTAEVILTLHDVKASASGGTLATALGIFDHYSLSELAAMRDPWCLCPVKPLQQSHSKPLLETVTGVRTSNDLGTLTSSLQGPADTSIVNRSWGLYEAGKLYGSNFHLNAYMNARNILTGFGIHLAISVGMMSLILSPVRWLLKQYVYQPGDGPTQEQVKNEFAEWRAIAHADSSDPDDRKRAYCRVRWDGSMYHLTGVCLAEAAIVIAREKTFAHQLGGGILTPATLGVAYLERLKAAGLAVEIKTIPE